MRIPPMVDMSRTPAEKVEAAIENAPGPASIPDYPYGLSICLTQDELEKLGLDDDVEVGDMLHIHAMAKVTSVSKTDNEATGPQCRVEAVLAFMAPIEDEDTEGDDESSPAEQRRGKFYAG